MLRIICLIIISAVFFSDLHAQRKYKGRKKKTVMPYYQEKGNIILNGGLYFTGTDRAVSATKYFAPEISIFKNFSAGPVFIHYRYKTYTDLEYASIWIEEKTNYDHLLLAGKVTYHLNGLLNKLFKLHIHPRKYELYASALLGYNLLFVNPTPLSYVKDEELRAGIYLGARYFYKGKLGLSLEGGYSKYGYMGVGLSYKIASFK